jgi:hypothetical protein
MVEILEEIVGKIVEIQLQLSGQIKGKIVLFYSFIYITQNLSLSQTNQYQSIQGNHLGFYSFFGLAIQGYRK